MSARLSVVDEMFLRTHRGFGTPIVMQGLWRTDDRVEAATLDVLTAELARGPLGRRVVRPRIPGARPRFEPRADSFPVEYSEIDAGTVLAWADEQGALPVDPERGPGWRLACARPADGGTVLSLVCSHVIADARGLAAAIAAALQGGQPLGPGGGAGTVADVWDATRLARRVTEGTARAVAGLAVSGSRRAELRRFLHVSGNASPGTHCHSPVSAVLDVDADRWDAVADREGGTPNSLFLSVVAEVARQDGESRPLTISVPMDLRRRDHAPGTANSVAMVEVDVSPWATVADVRAASRAAFAAPTMTSPAGFPEEMLQLVPDRVAHALTGNPGERDVLCSNIGPLPDTLGWVGGHRATGIVTRAVHPGAVTSRTRLSAYLSLFGGRYTLALESLDSPGRAALRERAENVLAGYGLTTRGW
ncbi:MULTISPECIES: hypothetical protein [unclassified Rhodococcus (in: high G+C Gram-positive bacteria)]|uniref:hypothetical protein n=1 Tax=unclassified Rhodococcus (in: high G+C Gram-positive bacteria) TaxID=192944 RepID=UPI00163AE94B|nr:MULTISPECIES: hypothetical protein [unclassified Rhodococcus (in: high G+C Gram-positive bacteria)]MBC2642829.1 hypothetical protein [Rhodococcus sp. 3A]MBC2892429.1 hypothetical protein [Rhodococcus sp. 4CII]